MLGANGLILHFVVKNMRGAVVRLTKCQGSTPAMCIPPPPQPERLVMRKDEAVGIKEKCKFVYLRLDNFLRAVDPHCFDADPEL
jgi:hypothetical protein